MLEDSAKIQLSEAQFNNKRRAKKNNAEKAEEKKEDSSNCRLTKGNRCKSPSKKKNVDPKEAQTCSFEEPLYKASDIPPLLNHVLNNGFDYRIWIKLTDNVNIKFYPSGHVMGGAIIVMQVKTGKKKTNFCFTGDLGRKDGIILPPPEVVQESIDHMVIESTYGGKIHPERDYEINKMLKIISQGVKKKKKIYIPSFALERSQEIIYILSYYMHIKAIPRIQIYLDSPLAKKITEIFAAGWDQGLFSDQGRIPFNPFNTDENPYFKLISEKDDSDNLINWSGNCIVIAGSGMCDAGRIRGHLRANLEKPTTIVFLVGFMGKNTLGRHLKEGNKIVKMNGTEIHVKASIKSFDSFSAHADGEFLVNFTKSIDAFNKKSFKNIFIVHGEEDSAKKLAIDLRKSFSNKKTKIRIPAINAEFTL